MFITNYFNNGEIINTLYDCSFGSSILLHKGVKRPNKSIGMSFLFLSLTYLILYLPFIIIMLKKCYLKHVYYMITLFISIINILYLIIHGLGHGYLSYNGETFCTNPKTIIFVGSFSVALWGTYCLSVLVLLLNKCLLLYDKKLNQTAFKKNNIIICWFGISTLYFIFLLNFTPPLIFSTIKNSWYFYPYIDHPKHQNSIVPRNNILYLLNNYFTIILPTILLSSYILTKVGQSIASRKPPKLRKHIFTHSFIHTILLTIIMCVTSCILIIYHFNDKNIIGILCEVVLLTANGLQPVLFLVLNSKMKNDIYSMCHYTPKSKVKKIINGKKIATIT